MYATKDKKGHIKVSLTLTFKVNCQGQVTDFVFFEILGLEKVRIDTDILSVPYIQPEIWKVIKSKSNQKVFIARTKEETRFNNNIRVTSNGTR